MNYLKYKNKTNGLGIRIVETGDVFETRAQCAEFLGVTPGMITMCLNGSVKSCRGYHLDIIETNFSHPLTPDIIKEACDMLSLSRRSIVRALNSESNIVADYIFEYADREDRLLYGDEDNKQLSWLRIGIFR